MFSQFLSFIYSGQEATSPYQILLQGIPNPDELSYPDAINDQLESSFFYSLFNSLPTECIEFLEFHFQIYIDKNPEKEINFLSFIEETSTNTKYFRSSSVLNLHNNPTVPNRKLLIHKWIEKKRSDIDREKPQTNTNNTMKTPTRSEYNSTVLTEKQTLLLMYYLREKRIVLETSTNTIMGECFGQLTGYKQLRKHFITAGKDSFEVTRYIKDYETVINNLKELIQLIEDDKTDFSNKNQIE